MRIKEFVNPHSFFNSIDVLRDFLSKKFINFKNIKHKRIIRNSYQSDFHIKKYISFDFDMESIKNIYFDNQIFSYTNLSEKPKINRILKDNCILKSKQYIEYANKILKNQFSIFEKTYEFKRNINWHYGFFNNFYWKLEKSERIDIHPKGREIDVKYVWELNRHNFLPYLGFAYYFTNDETYAKEFKKIILDWIRKNPPLYGINWFSGLEISIRLISWIFTLYFFKDSKEVNNKEFFEKIFSSMFQHALYLKYFYTRSSFNHTVGDLFGIYLFSKIFEKINPMKKWERKFFNKLSKQISLQTRTDGTNIEQSVNYHRFVLEFFSLFMVLNLKSINEKEYYLMEKMFNYLLYIIKPNREFPLIGDFDDGKVLPLSYFENNLFTDLIDLGSILFHRADLKFISSRISPLSVLLLGSNRFEIYQKIQSQEPKKKVEFFNKAGYFVLRDNWSDQSNYLFIDYGKFGPFIAPHSHSGITNFIYSFKGKDIIIDSGTYTYNKSWNQRNYFRGSEAHNVLVINKKNQAKISDWFAWQNKPKIKRNFNENVRNLEFTCFHNGYSGFIVKRTIITQGNLENITIKDSVIKTQNISTNKFDIIDINFHLNGDLDVKIKDNIISLNNKIYLEVISKHKFEIKIKNSEYSPRYGFIEKNFLLNIHLNHIFTKDNKLEVETKIKSSENFRL